MYLTGYEDHLPTHSVWLAFITKPVGHEQLERVGLSALIRQSELEQLLLLHGLATGRAKIASIMKSSFYRQKVITDLMAVSLLQ